MTPDLGDKKEVEFTWPRIIALFVALVVITAGVSYLMVRGATDINVEDSVAAALDKYDLSAGVTSEEVEAIVSQVVSENPGLTEEQVRAIVEEALAADEPVTEETTAAPETTAPPEDKTFDTGTLPEAQNVRDQGAWEIMEIDLANDPIVDAWLHELKNPAPQLWEVFPNVDNPKVDSFDVANGMEYGQDDSPFCEQDQRCDWVIPAWHYRLISGDYRFLDLECDNTEDDPKGCLIVLINVMDASFTWRDQSVDNGFTVMGRYWNGDKLDQGVWGLVSHASANMLGMATLRNPNTGDVLNAPGGSNAGANCGKPQACDSVDVTVVVHAGDRVLAVAHTVVSR